jgi:DNA-binding SARP family transcriptional activator
VALAGPIRADRVAAMLWPAVAAKQADTSLRQRLYACATRRRCRSSPAAAVLQLQETVRTDLAASLERIDGDEHAALD